MNIAFVCGSLEPGRDGVGDYVRRLAVALQQQGHCVAAIALSDSFVKEAGVSTQLTEVGALTAVRLPATWPMAERIKYVGSWLTIFKADWLSLQFVPFAFQAKGLIFGLAKHLLTLGHSRWHLMVHELWVGMDQAAPAKHVWWGRLQRYFIHRLITTMQPKVIHTQTTLYQRQLTKMGFSSSYLPLFGNIPRVAVPAAVGPPPNTLALIVFGSIHPGTSFEPFTREVAEYVRQQGLATKLTFVGRCGTEQEHWVAIWQAAGLPLEILGEQPPERISRALLSSTLGLATTPAALLGKSGTVAAMHEHGLPVLCIAAPWQPRGIASVPLLAGTTVYQPGDLAACLQQVTTPSTSKVDDIAHQLSENLSAAG